VKRFPTPLQAVVLTLAGFAMAFFGCLGALSQYDSSEVLFGIALVVSIAGALALLAGLASIAFMFIGGVVRAIQDSRRKAPPADGGSATPPDPGTPPPPGPGPSAE
jgi:hypothetical protein